MVAPEIVQYPTLKMKRGDTFLFPFYVWEDKASGKKLPLENMTFKCHLRKRDELVAVIDCTVVDMANSIVVLSYSGSTEAWPIAKLTSDVEMFNTSSQQKVSSETFIVEIGKDETHD